MIVVEKHEIYPLCTFNKRRSCLVLNLLFHNAISTLIMRLVLIVKYRC